MAEPKIAPKRLTTAALEGDALKGVRLGVARFIEGYSPATKQAFNAALAVLKAQGAELVEIEKFDLAPSANCNCRSCSPSSRRISTPTSRPRPPPSRSRRSPTSSRSIGGAARDDRGSDRTCSSRRKPRPASTTRVPEGAAEGARARRARGHRPAAQGAQRRRAACADDGPGVDHRPRQRRPLGRIGVAAGRRRGLSAPHGADGQSGGSARGALVLRSPRGPSRRCCRWATRSSRRANYPAAQNASHSPAAGTRVPFMPRL